MALGRLVAVILASVVDEPEKGFVEYDSAAVIALTTAEEVRTCTESICKSLRASVTVDDCDSPRLDLSKRAVDQRSSPSENL